MGHFSTISFFSVVCSKLRGFTVFQFSYTDLNILIIAAGNWQLNTSSTGTIIYELPFLVFQCIRFVFCRNDFTLTAEIREHFHTIDNKDGSKAYFS
jgi:hypothetical protein